MTSVRRLIDSIARCDPGQRPLLPSGSVVPTCADGRRPAGAAGGRKVFVSFGSRRFPYLLDPEGFRIFCLLPPKCCAKSESKQELLLQPEHYVQNVSLTLSIRHPQDKSTGCRGANESDSQAGDRRQADKH